MPMRFHALPDFQGEQGRGRQYAIKPRRKPLLCRDSTRLGHYSHDFPLSLHPLGLESEDPQPPASHPGTFAQKSQREAAHDLGQRAVVLTSVNFLGITSRYDLPLSCLAHQLLGPELRLALDSGDRIRRW